MKIVRTKFNSVIIYLLIFAGYYKVCFYQIDFIINIVQIGILVLALFSCLSMSFHYKTKYIKIYLMFMAFVLFYLVSAVTSPSSISKSTSLKGGVTSILYCTIIYTLSNNYNEKFFLLIIKKINFIIIMIYFLINFSSFLGALGTLQRVGSAINDNPIWVGRFCAYTVLVMVITDIQQENKIKWIESLKYIFVIFVLICTGSKGAWLALIVPLALYFFVIFSDKDKKKKEVKKRVKRLIFKGFVVVAGVIAVYGSTILSFILYRFNSAKSIKRGSRIDMYIFTMKMIKERPIWGYGIGSWSQKYWNIDQFAYPHNIILELWFECGLLCVLFLLLYFFIVVIYEKKSRNSISLILVILFSSSFIGAMFSGSILVGNREIYLIPILIIQCISKKGTCRIVRKSNFNASRVL